MCTLPMAGTLGRNTKFKQPSSSNFKMLYSLKSKQKLQSELVCCKYSELI